MDDVALGWEIKCCVNTRNDPKKEGNMALLGLTSGQNARPLGASRHKIVSLSVLSYVT